MKLLVRTFFVFALLLVGLFFGGCSEPKKIDDYFASSPQAVAPPTQSTQSTQSAQPTPPNAEVARFHVGETVSIIFSGTPEEIPPHEESIKEDGNLTLPLIGSVKALGKTAGELQSEIHDLYVPKYYVRLNVVIKPGDLVYYVRGEVKQPGRQLYVGETTVSKAITSAGDFTDFASHTVNLIRSNGQVIEVNVNKALSDPTLDPQIYPGDQIDVHRRLF